MPQPNDRPRIKDVLQCLQMAPSLPERLSPNKSHSLSPSRGLPQRHVPTTSLLEDIAVYVPSDTSPTGDYWNVSPLVSSILDPH